MDTPHSIILTWEIVHYALFALSLIDIVSLLVSKPTSHRHTIDCTPSEWACIVHPFHLCETLCRSLALLRFFLACAITIINAPNSKAPSLWVIPSPVLFVCLVQLSVKRIVSPSDLIRYDHRGIASHVWSVVQGIWFCTWFPVTWVEVWFTMGLNGWIYRILHACFFHGEDRSADPSVSGRIDNVLAAFYSVCGLCVAAVWLLDCTVYLEHFENNPRPGAQVWALVALVLFILIRKNACETRPSARALSPEEDALLRKEGDKS